MSVKHENICELYCVDTDRTQQAEVLDFNLHRHLTVAIAGNKITLSWNPKFEHYQGKMAGLDFTSEGPKHYNVRTTR